MKNGIRIVASGVIIAALLLSSWFPVGGKLVSAAGNDEQQPELPPLELPEKGNPKLDSQLNRMVKSAGERRSSGMMQQSSAEQPGETVRVIIECLPGEAETVRNSAGDLGTVEVSYKDLVQVNIPVSQLESLANNPGISLVRTPMEMHPDTVTSEGVELINADDWQTTGYNGTGVKIAIIDMGFAGYEDRQSEGELPSTITANWSGIIGQGTSVHGTACAEIIYDIAPGAELYLVSVASSVELGNAVNWLITEEVDIISHSVGWFGPMPGDGTGTICSIVDTARAGGILWSNSAGNYAQNHWGGDFSDPDTVGWHDFSVSDYGNSIYVPEGYPIRVYLRWDDEWGSSSNDYNLYLINSTSQIVDGSTYTQSGSGNPYESLSYTANYTGWYGIAIYSYNATEAVNFSLINPSYPLQYQTASGSLAAPADSANATTVGAVDWDTPDTITSYSSQGPTDDGRIKPDIVAPTAVSTVSYGTDNFSGTSASAPHVAGAAALVKEAYPSYTPAQIQSYLETEAFELGDAGKDNVFGSGRLDLGTLPALASPTVVTNTATDVTSNSAVLNGNLTSLGGYGSANISFEWGTASDNLTNVTSNQSKTSTESFNATISGLAPSTIYYFRAKATANPTVYGSTANFTTTAVLVSANVTPDNPSVALGRSQQFSANGTYSDASTSDITGSVTWESSNTTVATVNATTGLAQSFAEGTTLISATSGIVTDNTTLTVGPKVVDAITVTPPNAAIAKGRTQQFTATGTYSDASTANLTLSVTWISSNTTVATINSAGLAQGFIEGQTTITANTSGVQHSATLTVSTKVLDTIDITPGSPSIAAGRTQYLTATGTYSDASTTNLTASVTWTSSNTSVARVYSNGLVRSYVPGTTVITASSGSVIDNTTITVGAAVLDSVTVTPVNPSVTFVSGNPPALQFVATAIYSDGTSSGVTGSSSWSSDDTSVATINSGTGLATTAAQGATSINATYSGKMGYTTLTVFADTVAPVVALSSPKDGQVLSSTTVNVTGTVDDLAATANVTVNGGTPVALTLSGDGSFNQSVSTLTANSSNNILVTATDGSGNTGTSGTVTVTVSPIKPGITITQPASELVTNNPSLTVSGTVTGNVSTVNLILNGSSQSVAVSGGSFSQTITLSEGTNIVVINAYINGHSGDSAYRGTSGIITVTLDTAPPAVTVNCPSSGSVISTAACTVSGTIDDPDVSTANLTLNGSPQAVSVTGGNFNQSITLISGSNTITVLATDEVGNTSTPGEITLTFDNTKPEVTITSPAGGTVTNTANRNVSGTVNDPSISAATLYLNGSPQAISVTDGSYSENVTLSSGANTLEVRASDGATPANTGTSGNVTITLDNTAPTITIGLSDPTDSITITVSSNEALSAAPAVTVNPAVTMQKTGINTWTGTYGSSASPLTSGNYTVTASATDRAGNNKTKNATFCKETVTISENATVTVGTSTATLQIDTTANVTDASISVTQHIDSPSGNTGNPSAAGLSAGVFIEIVASPELRDNLEGIYIEVSYDPDDLPADTDESTLKLYLWDVATGAWQEVAGSGVNTVANYIYGTLTHLSKFGGFGTAIVAPPDTPSSPPVGGGGGGGGTPAGWTRLSDIIGSNGIFTANTIAQSEDKQCTLQITAGVKALDKYGNRFTSIIMLEDDSPPATSESNELVGKVYEINPSGATFEPAISLTMCYDPETLPENVSENEMYIAYWTGTEWEAFESTVDTEAGTVSTETTHFTKFAIIGKPPAPKPSTTTTSKTSTYTRPAEFEVSGLSVTPSNVKSGETVIISIVVANTGDQSGTYTTILIINDIEEDRKEITLGADKSETVTFSVSKDDEGSYEVKIGASNAHFIVIPTVGAIIPVEEETIIKPAPKSNWGLIGGVIAGSFAVVAFAVYFFTWRKRGNADATVK
ncbi:Ig-like domain-containing protein [Chloroflexota bacterium]